MSHDGNCYCPNCDRSYDREGEERYLRYVETMLSHEQERLSNVMGVAMRGFVAAVKYSMPPAFEPLEWQCPSCRAHQETAGPCQNKACVPGEVARALQKETRAQRIAARGTPPQETGE